MTDSTLPPELSHLQERYDRLRQTFTQSDADALANDWRVIGADMRRVMADYSHSMWHYRQTLDALRPRHRVVVSDRTEAV